MFPRNDHGCAEAYCLRGVEVEVAHFEVGEIERRLADALDGRDANLWVHQTLATNALNVLGVLAALNRQFYSTFQFKRMRHFVASLPVAPPNLAERLEEVVCSDQRHGIDVLEGLVRESLELVARHLPEADTSVLRYPPGSRQRPWRLAELGD